VSVSFPVIADLDTRVARAYGMLHPAASTPATVRAVFLIDPRGIVRAVLYYPLTTGRPIPELLRLIDALQTTDAQGVSTPACWLPGQPVVAPAPATARALADEEARREQYDYRRWYLRFVKAAA
jgi:peroxiredoxin (alkyl hydroperoxide reductase subunit C)